MLKRKRVGRCCKGEVERRKVIDLQGKKNSSASTQRYCSRREKVVGVLV